MTFLEPLVPLPRGLKVRVTTRTGGVSQPPYQGFNLAAHVGDEPQAVETNRKALEAHLSLPSSPLWLAQCHSSEVVRWSADEEIRKGRQTPPGVDGSLTALPGLVLGILTADCLPVVFWNQAGTQIAAVHGGWKGVAGGILEKTVTLLGEDPAGLGIWIGPSISQRAYEVGPEVREEFLSRYPRTEGHFQANSRGRWQFDLPGAAADILRSRGVQTLHLSGLCTATDPRFYSYRRDGVTGRIATLAWMEG